MKNTIIKNTVFAFLSLSTAVSTMGYAADSLSPEEEVLVNIPDDTLEHIASLLNWRKYEAHPALRTHKAEFIRCGTRRLLESAIQSGHIEPGALSELKTVAVYLPELFNGAVDYVFSLMFFRGKTVLQVPYELSHLLVPSTERFSLLLQGENIQHAAYQLFDVPADEAIENWQSAAVQHYFRKKRFYHEAAADVGAVTAVFDSLLERIQADFKHQNYVDIDTFIQQMEEANRSNTPVPETTLVIHQSQGTEREVELERILRHNPDQLVVVDALLEEVSGESSGALSDATSERYEINLGRKNLPDYPQHLSSVTFKNLSSVTFRNLAVVCQSKAPVRIGKNFFFCCGDVQSLDLSGISNITEVSKGFLSSCISLTSIDLSSLSKVTEIGMSFLAHCRKLQSLDLSPLSQVTKIGDNFLRGSRNIKSLYITNPLLAQQVLQKIAIDDLTIYVPFSDREVTVLHGIINNNEKNIQLQQVGADFDFAAVSGDTTNEAMRVVSGGGGGGVE